MRINKPKSHYDVFRGDFVEKGNRPIYIPEPKFRAESILRRQYFKELTHLNNFSL